MNPENTGWDADYATFVATDLIQRGHRVFALEPWYWNDHGESIERLLQADDHTYWTDTERVVDCTCGEFARFYELHATNATLVQVARLGSDSFRETQDGLQTNADRAFFFPERALHIRMGLGQSAGVVLNLTFLDGPSGAVYEAGYWNLPLENAKNRHPLSTWTLNGTGEARSILVRIPMDEIMNGGFYIEGPPGLVLPRIEVTEA
jgi:hypothetical protein